MEKKIEFFKNFVISTVGGTDGVAVYATEGNGTIYIGEVSFPLKKGKLILVPANKIWSWV